MNLNNCPLTGELVITLGQTLADYPVSPVRSQELAGELTQLHLTTRNQAKQLVFDDEPAAFATLLDQASR